MFGRTTTSSMAVVDKEGLEQMPLGVAIWAKLSEEAEGNSKLASGSKRRTGNQATGFG
jgi:hypothetical protein